MTRLITLLCLLGFLAFGSTLQAQQTPQIVSMSPDSLAYHTLSPVPEVTIKIRGMRMTRDSIEKVTFNQYYCFWWHTAPEYGILNTYSSAPVFFVNDSIIKVVVYLSPGMNNQVMDLYVHFKNGRVLHKDKALKLVNINTDPIAGPSPDFAVTPSMATPGQTLDIVVSGGPGFAQASGTVHGNFGQGRWPIVTNYTEMVGNQILANITIPPNTKAGCYDILAMYMPKTMFGQYFYGRCQNINNALCISGARVSQPGRIRGRVFEDQDRNCISIRTEKGARGVVVEAMPGPHYAITDSNGYYTLDVPYGTYSIQQKHSGYWQAFCPTGGQNATVDSLNGMVDEVNFADTLLLHSDLGVFVHSGILRPGFTRTGSMRVFNNASFTDKAQATLVLDDSMHFVSSVPPPDSAVGDTFYYHWDAIETNSYKEVLYDFSLAPDPGMLGRALWTNAWVYGSIKPDAYFHNDHHEFYGMVQGSYDPNDKSVSPPVQFFEKDSVFSYRIRFQNTGTDTAFMVTVRDTIPAQLDISTLKTMVTSHRHKLSILPGNVAEWRFANILLLDSGRSEPKSHGYIDFTILRKKNLAIGTQIDNRAGIYFDFNPPVMTNYASTTLSSPVKVREAVGTNGVTVYPNPLGSGQSLLRVQGKADLEGAEFQLLDVTGRRVAASAIRQGAAALERSRLKPGLYSFHITHKGKPASTGRLVLE